MGIIYFSIGLQRLTVQARRLNNMHKYANSAKNRANDTEFGLNDGGDDAEHKCTFRQDIYTICDAGQFFPWDSTI